MGEEEREDCDMEAFLRFDWAHMLIIRFADHHHHHHHHHYYYYYYYYYYFSLCPPPPPRPERPCYHLHYNGIMC